MPNHPEPTSWPTVARLDALPRASCLALLAGGESWSLTRLADATDQLAAGLVAFGVEPGDRVALHLRSGPEMAIIYFACFRIGAIAAPLNLRFKQAELEPVLRRLKPRLYLGDREAFRQVAEIDVSILPADARFLVNAPGEPAARSWELLQGDLRDLPASSTTDQDAVAVLLLTSGTTGQPKFVAHSLRTLTALADNCGQAGMQNKRRIAFYLPMVHMAGLLFFLASLRLGMQVVFCDPDDPDAILDAVEQYRCDFIGSLTATPTLLTQAQRRRPRGVSSLRLCLMGGDAPMPGQQDAFKATFGCTLRSFWASTEAPGSFTYGPCPGPVSRLLPQVGMRLIDAAGDDVAPGEPGEMLLRGPHVMLGYWQGPGVLAGLEGGWYRSGDLMRLDASGNVWFVGRLKDFIVRGSSNISPVEVEQVIAAHPCVEEAAVTGVPDPVLGQRVMAAVHLKAGADADVLADILAWAREWLADYKLPERLLPVTALPRNPLGKIDRQQLAAMLEDWLATTAKSTVMALPGSAAVTSLP